MLTRFAALVLLFFMSINVQSQTVGEAYSVKEFQKNFKAAQIVGDIKKIVHLKNSTGSYFMVFTVKIALDTEVEVDHLHAYGFKETAGELQEEWQFKDFGNPIYWPRFYLKDSGMVDTNHDGVPEYVVAYFGSADGLDAKPLKIITYIKGVKFKATALYPGGNENDEYRIIYDADWKLMPKSTQLYVTKLFKKLKPFPLYEYKGCCDKKQ
jgi:hypothetical protein